MAGKGGGKGERVGCCSRRDTRGKRGYDGSGGVGDGEEGGYDGSGGAGATGWWMGCDDGAVLGEIPAASAGMTDPGRGGDGEEGGYDRSGGAGATGWWWDATVVLFSARYPCSGQGQAPRQARV